MAATPSIKIIKQFTFKDSLKPWSNRYHFNGGTPSDGSHWTTLSDAIVAAEKACYQSGCTLIGAVGYAAGSDVPVFSKTYSVAGTAAWGGSTPATGEAALLVRYSTAARSSKNHPVYLFNYYHSVLIASDSEPDKPYPSQKTAFETYLGEWLSGFSDGVNTYVRSGPNGATATGGEVETYLTHRDFPR